jgi:hypothetical protein
MPRPRTWAQYTSDLEAWRIIRLKTQEAEKHMKLHKQIAKSFSNSPTKNNIIADQKNLSYQPTDEQMMADLEAYMKN